MIGKPTQFAPALRDPLADCLWVRFIPNAEAMEQARKLGKQVWLALHIGENRPDIWDEARANKVDGICTDWPPWNAVYIGGLVAKPKGDE